MSDIIDNANDTAELFLRAAVSKARIDGAPPSTGRCFNCEEPVPSGLRWCDVDCRNDWQKRVSRA